MSARTLIVGHGHLALRLRELALSRRDDVVHRTHPASTDGATTGDATEHMLQQLDLGTIGRAFLVDDADERNLELLIALLALDPALPIAVSLFNENVAPHLQSVNPNVRVLNPARLAAPAFAAALDQPLARTLRYTPTPIEPDPVASRGDPFVRRLMAAFATLVVLAIVYFHTADGLSWIDSLYFVVVTIATVGYGDISLAKSSTVSKLVGVLLILSSTAFIWMIFSLTVDRIIKQRGQLALGRKRYIHRDHVILCGCGRLGYQVAELLTARGETVVIVERDADSTNVQHMRSRGIEVYVGDARLPRVLEDVGVTRAKALYSLTDDDFTNLQVGLNARSFQPAMRVILRIFGATTSARLREHLDIHLAFSMSAIADEPFLDAVAPRQVPRPG